uniref:Reverse transcriptase Ty1/copia-type domain-containing protein n=1 Tax=Solanum lycopersicum TaxID=4081 RepID=A0A3Q7EC46_SOLLC
MRLSEIYGPARSQILMMNPLPTVGKAYAMIISDENQRITSGLRYGGDVIEATTLYANRGGYDYRNTGRGDGDKGGYNGGGYGYRNTSHGDGDKGYNKEKAVAANVGYRSSMNKANSQFMIWHYRMGSPSYRVLKQLYQSDTPFYDYDTADVHTPLDVETLDEHVEALVPTEHVSEDITEEHGDDNVVYIPGSVPRVSSRMSHPPVWMKDYVTHVTDSGLSGARPSLTHLETNMKLTSTDYMQDASDELFTDINRYQRLIGKLLYLTNTRPDIAFSKPTLSHWNATLKVVKYVKTAPGLGIPMSSDKQAQLTGFCDADWAACLNTRRSVTSYLLKYGKSLIAWKSKK